MVTQAQCPWRTATHDGHLEGTHPAVHPVPKTGDGRQAVGLDTSTFLAMTEAAPRGRSGYRLRNQPKVPVLGSSGTACLYEQLLLSAPGSIPTVTSSV